MRRRLHILLPLLLSTLATVVVAQRVPLVQGRLYADADRIWSYNLYEHSRWGLGLRWTPTDSLSLDAYLGYGLHDRQLKGGLSTSLNLGGRRLHALHAALLHDLVPAGSRGLGGATLADFSTLSAFMNRRMALATQPVLGTSWSSLRGRHTLEARAAFGSLLFDSSRLLYATQGDTLPPYTDYCLRHHYASRRGLATEFCVGYNERPLGAAYLRLLAQLARSRDVGAFRLGLFAQGGIAVGLPRVGYMHLFDLGGTASAPLYFERSLLTARPNEFTASHFALLVTSARVKKPLFSFYNRLWQVGSYPRPFVRVAVAIGGLDADAHAAPPEGMAGLQAPTQGLAEGAVGAEGLLRIGMVDWGLALAARLTPPSAPYHLPTMADNLHLLLTASLII